MWQEALETFLKALGSNDHTHGGQAWSFSGPGVGVRTESTSSDALDLCARGNALCVISANNGVRVSSAQSHAFYVDKSATLPDGAVHE